MIDVTYCSTATPNFSLTVKRRVDHKKRSSPAVLFEMSGIVGIVNFDGAPLDQGLPTSMVEHLALRGQDPVAIWCAGNVGMGHTLMATTHKAVTEKQPLTVDRHTWITADARIDGRGELIDKLSRAGLDVGQRTPNPELMLNAYNVWGQACVNHLLGDLHSPYVTGGSKRYLSPEMGVSRILCKSPS